MGRPLGRPSLDCRPLALADNRLFYTKHRHRRVKCYLGVAGDGRPSRSPKQIKCELESEALPAWAGSVKDPAIERRNDGGAE
jgi:hypothetical protein